MGNTDVVEMSKYDEEYKVSDVNILDRHRTPSTNAERLKVGQKMVSLLKMDDGSSNMTLETVQRDNQNKHHASEAIIGHDSFDAQIVSIQSSIAKESSVESQFKMDQRLGGQTGLWQELAQLEK